ncbi:MAG TPA: response regulator [Haliangium sp.]|nr:response regulator [Haliangium sp.]
MLLKKRILLAEDDDAIVELVYAALDGAGYERLRAENGARAIDMLRIYTPDMLVLDVMMPEMDGIEAAERIRHDELLAEIPILMLTALSGVDNKVEGLEAGADAYLPKPFDLREFKAQITALLRSKKQGPARNPITSLPAPRVANEALKQLLEKGEDSAIIHFKVREFDDYALGAHFEDTKSLLASLTALFQDKMRAHFQFTSFLGHMGGGEFVIAMPREAADGLARDVVQTFEASQARWLGHNAPSAVASLSLAAAVVSTEKLGKSDIAKLAERASVTMDAATAQRGSRYVVWTPELR